MGSKGSSPLLPLESSRSNFERGQVDVFGLETLDVGRITRLQICHDNRWEGGERGARTG